MRNNRRHFLIAAASTTVSGLALAKLPDLGKIYVPFAVGGTVDLIARVLANALRGSVATALTVENKSGASGRIAVDALRLAPPDGLTFMLNSDGIQTVFPYTFKQLSYQPFVDIAAISIISRFEFAFAVGPAVPEPVKSLKDYIGWLKGDPKRTAFATPGAGTPLHFLPLLLGAEAGISMTPVHYRGSAATFPDVIGGQVPAVSAPLPELLTQFSNGKLRILATSGKQRSKFTPEVATYEEQGWPQLTSSAFHALFVNGKTPLHVQEQLSATVRKALSQPEVATAFAALYVEPSPSTPAEALAAARRSGMHWAETVKKLGYEPE